MVVAADPADTCSNCGAALAGRYCAACGQKRFVDDDRRLFALLHQFITSATDLDGRVWRSVLALMVRPGLLSREYFLGRRARWIGPVSLFFAVNVFYFVAPLHGGDFAPQFEQQVPGRLRVLANDPGAPLDPDVLQRTGQVHSRYTAPWIEARVAARDEQARRASGGATTYTMRDYRRAYDAKADDVSKALVILHVVFTAAVLKALLVRTRRYFAEHFVFALHFFAFALILLQLVVQPYDLVAAHLPDAFVPPRGVLDWIVRIVLPAYAALAIRRAYATTWIAAIAIAAAMLGAMIMINLYLFRTIDFLVTYALT